jgi:hypothetical protein
VVETVTATIILRGVAGAQTVSRTKAQKMTSRSCEAQMQTIVDNYKLNRLSTQINFSLFSASVRPHFPVNQELS